MYVWYIDSLRTVQTTKCWCSYSSTAPGSLHNIQWTEMLFLFTKERELAVLTVYFLPFTSQHVIWVLRHRRRRKRTIISLFPRSLKESFLQSSWTVAQFHFHYYTKRMLRSRDVVKPNIGSSHEAKIFNSQSPEILTAAGFPMCQKIIRD